MVTGSLGDLPVGLSIEEATAVFSALAQPTRLEAYRLALRYQPFGLVAGDFSRLLAVPHNTMSTHLAVLARANLIRLRREGRAIYYSVKLEGFRSLIGFLMRDCCGGRAEICAPLVAELSCCAPTRKPERARG